MDSVVSTKNEGVPALNPSLRGKKAADFELERYKFILQEIRFLNENTHKYLTLFQTLATAIIGGGVALFVGWKNLKLTPEMARVGIESLLALFSLLSIFVIFLILAGIFSWFDYRREECELLDKAVEPSFRKPPTANNFWRWQETQFIVFVGIVAITVIVYVRCWVLPLIP